MHTEIGYNMERDYNHLIDSISQDLVNIHKGLTKINTIFNYRNGSMAIINNELIMTYSYRFIEYRYTFHISNNHLHTFKFNNNVIYPSLTDFPDFTAAILLSEILEELKADNKASNIDWFTGE